MNNTQYMFELTKMNDNQIDYNILFNQKTIGELQLTIHHGYVFIRHINIIDQFRRRGHATNVINYVSKKYRKPIELCISTHSISAILFWKKYFIKNNVENLRGNIYRISKITRY